MNLLPLVWSPGRALAAVLNVALAVGASFAAGYWAHRLPVHRLDHDGFLLRIRSFEADGHLYERRLGIRRWKQRVPEAGGFFAGGVSKRRLAAGADGRDRLTIETRRAERAHWVALAFVGTVPALWNHGPALLVMALYGVAINGPCIAVQRYNRARLARLSRRVAGAPDSAVGGPTLRSSTSSSVPPGPGRRTRGSNMP